MGYDIDSILQLGAICGAAVFFLGLVMLIVASRKASDEFREKGYLRPPSGTRWFRFLMFKHYDSFQDPLTRFFFGITHACLMATIFVLAALTILIGSEIFLNGLDGISFLSKTHGLPK